MTCRNWTIEKYIIPLEKNEIIFARVLLFPCTCGIFLRRSYWFSTGVIFSQNLLCKHKSTQKGQKGFTLEWICMCFIRIHKVKSSKYEWSLDLLTVIFDSWISISNTKGTQRFYSWKVFICFFKIYHVKSSNYEWSLNKLAVIFDRWFFITYPKGHRFHSWMNIWFCFNFPILWFPYSNFSRLWFPST